MITHYDIVFHPDKSPLGRLPTRMITHYDKSPRMSTHYDKSPLGWLTHYDKSPLGRLPTRMITHYDKSPLGWVPTMTSPTRMTYTTMTSPH